MERFLTRYVQAPLARTVQLEALAANQRALLALREGGAAADLADALSAGAACWWLLRPVLAKQRRRAVRDSVRRQRRLLAVAPLPRRKLARTLERQSAWLGELAAAPPPADPVILDRLARAYRQARREAPRDPTGPRLRKRLARLVLCEELLSVRPGPSTGGSMPGASARRRYLALLGHAAGDGGGQARPSRGLERGRYGKRTIRRLVAEAFELPSKSYRSALPRALWASHRPVPWQRRVAPSPADRQGGESS